MAVTKAWDETDPTDADALTDGNEAIKDLKQAIRERQINGGVKWGLGGGPTTDADDGKLTCGIQGTTGILTLIENEAEVVICTIKDGTDAGAIKEFEFGDGIAGSEQYRVTAHTLRGNREHVAMIPVPRSSIGRVLGVAFHNNTGADITLIEVDAMCFTAPSGASVTFDIHKITSGWTDPNAAGTSIVSSPPVISILTTALRAAAPITVFNDAILADDDIWVFEVDLYTAPAADMLLTLRYRRID